MRLTRFSERLFLGHLELQKNLSNFSIKNIKYWVAVVARLVEWSLSEDPGSNPAIRIFFKEYLFAVNKEKETWNGPLKQYWTTTVAIVQKNQPLDLSADKTG